VKYLPAMINTIALVLSPVTTRAVVGELSPVPSLTGRVMDDARILSDSDRLALAQTLDRYERTTHHQIAVLTVTTLHGEEIRDFVMRVFNAWHGADSGWNHGTLITIAVREHKMRIDVGRDMSGYISSEAAKAIMDNMMTPAFKRGDFAGGIVAAVNALMEKAPT
jgi:uncharacterized protein